MATKAVSTKAVKAAARVQITAAEVEQHAATVRNEHGTAGSVLATQARIMEESRTTEAGLRAWADVALEAKAIRYPVVKFGEVCGGDKNSLGRLSRTALILAAFERKGQRVSALMVQTVANRTSDRAMPALLDSIKAGKTDLPTARKAAIEGSKPSATRQGTPNRTTGAESTASGDFSIKPSQYAAVLEAMAKYISTMPEDAAPAFVDTLAPSVKLLALAVQTVKGKVPAPGTKRAAGKGSSKPDIRQRLAAETPTLG